MTQFLEITLPEFRWLSVGSFDRVPGLGPMAAYAKQAIRDKLIEHRQYIEQHGEDMPEVREWTWGGA